MKENSRRNFLKNSIKGAIATSVSMTAFPSIVPASVFGKFAPSNRINIGAIGVGRISREHDMPLVLKQDMARIIAVCDLDTKRAEDGKKFVNDFYAKKENKAYDGVTAYQNFHELLANKDIDAVIISTPDHWHAQVAIHSAEAGKDIYMQKPASLTIAEGRQVSNTIHRTGRILQMGSQQRSLDPWPQFHRACELVRNGRIGQLKKIYVGLPGDPGGDVEKEMPIPANLNYDMWLGQTPYVYYTEKRVHPQNDYSRPGWLRCEQFGAGMITGWGAHHVDTAHWGMDTELTGPVEVWGHAEFPKSGLWDVHGAFETHGLYANGVQMTISGALPNGVRFIGDEGWIFVTRSGAVTASDPSGPRTSPPLTASDPKILTSVIGPNEIHLYRSPEQHRNWLDSIRSRQPNIATAELGHRACSTCLVHSIAMHMPDQHLHWDSAAERFIGNDEANARIGRPTRKGYEI